MRTHPLNSSIALPDRLDQLKAVRRDGIICLTDEFKTYSGLIYKSAALDALSASFDYQAHGYDVLLRGPGMFERSPVAMCNRGKLYNIQQGVMNDETDKFEIENLEPDLKRYKSDWRDLFEKFANIVAPLVDGNFEVRLKVLQHGEEWFHNDDSVIGILPLGKGRRSTVCRAEDGLRAVRPIDGEFVMTTPGLEHSSPVSTIARAGLAVTRYDYDF